MKQFENSDAELNKWHAIYVQLLKETKHIKPIKKHIFTGLKNPIRVKKDVV